MVREASARVTSTRRRFEAAELWYFAPCFEGTWHGETDRSLQGVGFVGWSGIHSGIDLSIIQGAFGAHLMGAHDKMRLNNIRLILRPN